MNRTKLNKIIDAHAEWVNSSGEIGQRADLRDADLRRSNLRWADLRGANLHGADLRDADLRGADLRGAELRWAELHGTDLRWADLRGAILRWANLRWTELHGADLREADLRWADLRGTDLRGAKGIILLPVQDARGYAFCHATETESGWRIRAGCRDFSIPEAREHWGPGYDGDRDQGDMYLYAIDWLERKLERMQ